MFTRNDIESMKTKLMNKKMFSDNVKTFVLNSLNELTLKDRFTISLSSLSSQMYGPLLEKIIILKYGLTPVSSRINRGDCKNQREDYFEIKSGMVNNGNITLFQVRPYQEVKSYLCFHYDPISAEMIIHNIPKEEMAIICGAINCSSHGAGNFRNEEKQVRINICDEFFLKYRVSEEEVKNIVR